MRFEVYNHRESSKALSEGIKEEIGSVLNSANGNYGSAPVARKAILQQLFRKGWSDEVKIDAESRITITSIKRDIGLCLQFGNMGRFYSDLLKLQHLFSNKRIKAAVYILPEKAYALDLGSNLANFNRLTQELSIFESTITIPISVYGVWE